MKKSKKFRYGSFATLLTLGVLVIAIAVNVAVNLLGQRVTLRLDTTASSAFNISEEVDELLANLDQPVTIYVLNDEANFVAGGTGNSAAKDPSFTPVSYTHLFLFLALLRCFSSGGSPPAPMYSVQDT